MEFGKVEFAEGTYLGTVENGKANGYGRINFKNGDLYVGEVKNNCMTGIGAKATSSYISLGYFSNGKRNGKCCTIYKQSKDYFIGNYSGDVRSGQGTLLYGNKDVFVGNFQNDMPNGKGVLSHMTSISSGYFAEGQFSNGKLVGQYVKYSRTVFTNGATFYGETDLGKETYWGYGEWVDSGAHAERRIGYHTDGGKGSHTFNGAKVFDRGTWGEKALEVGDYGKMPLAKYGNFCKIYEDGHLYVGDYENNKKWGKGIYCEVGSNTISSLYIGNYNAGKKSGKGIIVSPYLYVIQNGDFAYDKLKNGYEFLDNGEHRLVSGGSGNFTKINVPTFSGQLNVGASGYGYAPTADNASFDIDEEIYSDYGAVASSETKKPQPKIDYMTAEEFYSIPSSPEEEVKKKPDKDWKKKGKQEEEEVEDKTVKVTKPVKTNENVKTLKEEYDFGSGASIFNGRDTLCGVKVKKEIHKLPPTIRYVCKDAFAGDTTVKEIIFDKSKFLSIDEGAFKGCVNLEKIDFSKVPEEKTYPIGKETFKGCKNLKTFILPDSYRAITPRDWLKIEDENAFDGCDNITFIDKRKNKEYDLQTFLKNHLAPKKETTYTEEKSSGVEKKTVKVEKEYLRDIVKPIDHLILKVNVSRIANTAFNCAKDQLKSIVFPPSLELLEKPESYFNKGMFEDFVKLEKVELKNTVNRVEIPFYTFKGCVKLNHVCFDAIKIDSYAFENCTSLKELNFPRLESIGIWAFRGCMELKKFTAPKLNYLACAFVNCPKLEEVYTPTLSFIAKGAFEGCSNLKRVAVSSSCCIDKGAFPDDKIKRVEIIDGVRWVKLEPKGSFFSNLINNIKWAFQRKRKK